MIQLQRNGHKFHFIIMKLEVVIMAKYIDSLCPGYLNVKFEIMSNGWTYWKDTLKVTIPVTAIENKSTKPFIFNLTQNYPNPFNPSTKIKYAISSRQFVTLKIYDVLGREIATLVNEEKPVGRYEVMWNALDIPSGV